MSHYPPMDPYYSPTGPIAYGENNDDDAYAGYGSPNDHRGIPPAQATSTPSFSAGSNVPPSKANIRRLNPPPPELNLDTSPISRDYLSSPLANVAVQYGSKLMGTGKQMVDKELHRYIRMPILKHYFSVDTTYVKRKLRIVLLPFFFNDWSIKYNSECVRLEPRNDVNSPDLYIPFMAYMTYVLIAGVLLGVHDLFNPEKLGIISSQALAWTIVEVIIQLVFMYFINIDTNINTFDIIAYSGYKFIGINVIILTGLSSSNTLSWVGLIYSCFSMAYFTVNTVKWRLMVDGRHNYGVQQSGLDYQRKQYFLLALAISHVFQMWWLSSSILKKLN